MIKRCEEDNARLAAAYKRYANDPNVDVNDPDNIIIALEKEIKSYRSKLDYAEGRIKALCAEQMRIIQLEQKLKNQPVTTLEAVQDNTFDVGEIIKAISDSGYNISINLFKEGNTDD